MQAPKRPPDESERLRELHGLEILDAPNDERFDRITRVASRAFDVPIALVSLVDANRQWFRACVGFDVPETPRSVSFCAHAILGNGPMVIPDAASDERFASNPLVTGPPGIRFYAGQPLRGPSGHKLGTLCLIDRLPRNPDDLDLELLADLAAWAERELNDVDLNAALARERDAALRLETTLDLLRGEDEVLRIINRTATVKEAMPAVLAQLGRRLGLAAGFFWAPDPERRELRCQAWWAPEDETLAEFVAVSRAMSFEPGEWLPGRVWSEGTPRWAEDAARDPELQRSKAAGRAGLHAVLALPMRSRDETTTAVIEFFSHAVLAADDELIATLTQIAGHIGDFIQRKASEAALVEERARFAGVLGAATDFAIVATDTHGVITVFSEGAERMLGYRTEDVVCTHTPVLLVAPEELQERAAELGVESGLQAFLSKLASERGEAREWTYVRKDGSRLPVHVSVTTIRSPSDELIGYVSVATDITAAKQREADLVAARDEAERANQAKSEFLSRMSHELRTPLNAILGFGQLLEMEALGELQEENVRHILRGGRHLLDLINEILDLSRIEGGSLSISPEPVRVADAVADALSLVAPLARERDVQLDGDLVGLDGTYVLADRQRFKQVLLNLLSNAIKYNRHGGTATVLVRNAEAGRLRIVVRDEGAGIPPNRVDRLFTPFDRLGAETSEVEGTGLGLALSKRLVEVMGGTLSVETAIGAGSSFVVELEVTEPPYARRSRTPPGARPIAELPPLPPGRILYIEDNPSNLRLAEQVFAGQEQVTLIAAMQGSIGLELARRHSPDLILLDVHLPDMAGREVLERLQADSSTRTIPVVVLSADATDRQIARLIERGARDYLTKPLDLRRLFDVVAGLLNERDQKAP